ncbi:DUF6575 domain-containing protein [Bizionia paragorgiae]|uniref:DUF6575 domain-containing protein n=1 Tax=Bizionia paragorgiae TaxID=283786 RepID=A0A1H4ASZ9_BIZPA|nr:DUF6575 domain-containing protein [Bizionia paragorgiae]SEA39019.1 hypothetical protein SAMN04487990_1124 [Bizionia paragorgiae]
MEQVKETLIPKNSLPKMIKIKDLIYFDGPLLSHFETIYNENFLFYWVDTNQDFNRWLIFRTSEELLDKYLEKKKSLLELMTDENIGNFYKVDIDNDLNYNNLSIIEFKDIPESYLPEKNSFYKFQSINSDDELKYISEKQNVGVLQAYYNESSKIGKGTIELEILAESLNDFSKINKGIRKAFIVKERSNFNKTKSKNSQNKFDEQAVLQASSFHYFGNTSRSFGALFKPASQQSNFPSLISVEDRYVEFLVKFFQSSSDKNEFTAYIKDVDKTVIDSYKKLLGIIKKSKIQFNLNYQNSTSNFNTSKKISYSLAGDILNNINDLVYDNSRDVYLTGRFTALNLKTGHYTFESVSEEQKLIEISTGYLDSDRREMSWKIKWEKLYNVVITRKEEKKTGHKKIKEIDTLVSFCEIEGLTFNEQE